MGHYKGRIVEILLEGYQNAAARLSCPEDAIPRAGQYLQAHRPHDEMEVVPTSLFAAGEKDTGISAETSFPITGMLPQSWQPGTELSLRGPLGRGFEMPKRAYRVALVALAQHPGRLLPLANRAIKQGAEVVLFSKEPIEKLALAVEQQNFEELPLGIKWADYLAADIQIENIEMLDTIFPPRVPATLTAEILVAAPMPCGGLAKCGVCTVHTRRGPRLACEDGPVFALKEFL